MELGKHCIVGVLWAEVVLQVQSPCAHGFDKPKLRMIEFGVRKSLLIKKTLAKKVGFIVVSQIYLEKVQSSGLFSVKGRENRRDYFCKTEAPSRIPLMISLFICTIKQELLALGLWERCRLERGVRDPAFHCVTVGVE